MSKTLTRAQEEIETLRLQESFSTDSQCPMKNIFRRKKKLFAVALPRGSMGAMGPPLLPNDNPRDSFKTEERVAE